MIRNKMLVLVVYHSHQRKLLVKHLALLKNKIIHYMYVPNVCYKCFEQEYELKSQPDSKIQEVITI